MTISCWLLCVDEVFEGAAESMSGQCRSMSLPQNTRPRKCRISSSQKFEYKGSWQAHHEQWLACLFVAFVVAMIIGLMELD